MKTAVGDEGGYAEPLAEIFLADGVTYEKVTDAFAPDAFATGEPEAAVERATRIDIIEEFYQNLDVSGWPVVKYMKAKYVANDGSVTPPKSKLQRIMRANGEVIYVLWTPVPVKFDEASDDVSILLAHRDGNPVAGWELSYHSWDGHWCECPKALYHNIPGVGLFHDACGRVRQHRISGNEIPNIGMPDDEYNGFYSTIKGNDAAHWDPSKKGMEAWRGGPVMYGQPGEDGVRHAVTGREIRGGRKEYREATSTYYHYDDGYFRDVERIKEDFKGIRDDDFAIKQEIADKQLPRKLGEV